MTPRPRVIVAIVAALLVGAGLAGAAPDCERVFAIGDLHGGDESFVAMLLELGLVDDELAWRGGEDCLVQTGDVVDRGAGARRILDLLSRLHEESGGRVEMLLGNHETMNMVGDLRYVSPGEFAAFADEEDPAERSAAFAAFVEDNREAGLGVEDLRSTFDELYPAGWFAHRRAFLPGGRYGSWLLERPVATSIGTTLFVHAGLIGTDAGLSPDQLTRRLHREIRQYHALRDRLVGAGWLGPFSGFADSFNLVAARLAVFEPRNGIDTDLARAAQKFLRLCREGSFIRPDGPVWTRDLAEADELAFAEQLRKILRSSGVTRIVVGHTTVPDGRIRTRFGSRVFVIDTGAGPAYEGRISALEIAPDGRVSAVYLDEREVLVEPHRDEAAIERMLQEGAIVHSEEIGSGITKPLRLTIEHEGSRIRAAFKHLHVRRMELTRFANRPAEFNFTDSYRYERAAYLLDRWLGLGMVPVSVIREVDGQEGAVVEWIEDAINEARRRADGVTFGDPQSLVQQRELMRIFDVLVANDDRHLGNQLLTGDDGRLHLIDHTRCFRERRALPEEFLETPISLPRWLLPRLEALDRGTLDRLLGDLIGRRQIKTLLARRDGILEKVAADRKRYGDDVVFFPEDSPAPRRRAH